MAPARRSICGRGAAGARRPFALHLRSRPCRRPSRGVALRTCPQDWAALQQSVARAGCGALLEGASERDYLWAYTTIKSRTAEVLVDGAKANLLAPNFDMAHYQVELREVHGEEQVSECTGGTKAEKPLVCPYRRACLRARRASERRKRR